MRPTTIPDILAAIAVRDSGTTRYAGQLERWDTMLAREIERLREELASLHGLDVTAREGQRVFAEWRNKSVCEK